MKFGAGVSVKNGNVRSWFTEFKDTYPSILNRIGFPYVNSSVSGSRKLIHYK